MLEIRLGSTLESRRMAWSSADEALDALGAGSGAALGAAALLEHRRSGARAPLPFVIAVGDAVRRGLPTAARASVLARTPLTGRVGQGQVGGDLGRRLASLADALLIHGRVGGQAGSALCVLVLEPDGTARLDDAPELGGLSPASVGERLESRYGACASLRVGPASLAGVPYANLASGSAHQSFVGRGGLGAALARHGLAAVVVRSPLVHDQVRPDSRLLRAMAESPRLLARAAGGTLELFEALPARGRELPTAAGAALGLAAGRELARAARAQRRGHHGCSGCPTPCGWEFAGPVGEERGTGGMHFSAALPLGPALGLDEFAPMRALVAVCDRLGLDAKEAGAALSVLMHAREAGRAEGEPAWGRVDVFARLLEQAVSGVGPGAVLARGAEALAAELGVEGGAALAQGEAARRDGDLAALLGQCVASRGAEPMRSYPFLVSDGVPRERSLALLAPMPVPPAAFDPRSPVGKGRLVWWHECFAAALDAIGFCAFSAAGVLSDGRIDLDGLAREILPEAWATPGGSRAGGPREVLLDRGARLVCAFRALNAGLAARRVDPPAWAAEALARPGMLEEYERLAAACERRAGGGPGLFEVLCGVLQEPATAAFAATSPAIGPRMHGCVSLLAVGPLAGHIGTSAELELALPATLGEVLEGARERWPDAGDWILRDGEPVPSVYRAGSALERQDLVRAGDVLHLISAISGG